MQAVTIQGVEHSYDGHTPVLSGIDLTIAPGELFFLLGGSGCGKTTLLRIVAGFIRPNRGSIRFGDRDVTSLPPERRDLGMVFQNYALWPNRDVADNVGFGLEVRGVAAAERSQRIGDVLDLVGLSPLAGRRIGELSGGQQQRVALARALVLKPAVLLLDEPLSNLDARLREQTRQEIRRLCKACGATALYVTHDQGEALATADRIALMANGRLAQVGTPRDLYERPASAAVASFLGEANLLSRAEASALVGDLGPGERFCLRPERIRIVTDGGLPAQISDGQYQGSHAAWTLRCCEITLLLRESRPPERRPGETLQVAISAADLVPVA